MSIQSLHEIAINLETDKGENGHNYIKFYENAFRDLRESPIKLLEIGILKGQSIQLWRRAFTHAQIYGADYMQGYLDKIAKLPRVTAIFVDQSDHISLENLASYGPFDIIIDDGSHVTPHQSLTWEILWPQINPGGWYIVEDRHVGYRPEFQQEQRQELGEYTYSPGNSITDYFVKILPELSWYGENKFSEYSFHKRSTDEPTDNQKTIASITFTPGLIAIQKLRKNEKERP